MPQTILAVADDALGQRFADDGLELGDRLLQSVVDHHMPELALGGQLVAGGLQAGGDRLGGVGPRVTRRVRSADSPGGAMNTCTASGMAART